MFLLLMLMLGAGPGPTTLPLFIVERTTNGNVVHYDARLDGAGRLDASEPVTVYWTIGSESGKREPLSFIERRRAWGAEIRRTSEGHYILTIVSQRRIPIDVYQDGDRVRAETLIDGSRAYLRKIFVNIEGPLLLPKVNYFDLFGTDVLSGAERYERMFPK